MVAGDGPLRCQSIYGFAIPLQMGESRLAVSGIFGLNLSSGGSRWVIGFWWSSGEFNIGNDLFLDECAAVVEVGLGGPFCLGDRRSFFAGDSESIAGVIDIRRPITGVEGSKKASSGNGNLDSFDVAVGEFPWIVRHGFGGGRVFVRGRNN